MSALESACRVCLASDATMAIEDIQLRETFKELTKTVLVSKHGLPENLCCICFSLLQRCHRFRKMAQRSEQILKNMLGHGVKVTDSTTIRRDLGISQDSLSRSAVWFVSTDNPLSIDTERHHGYTYMCVCDEKLAVKQVAMKEETSNNDIYSEADILAAFTDEKVESLDKEVKSTGKDNNIQTNNLPDEIFNCNFCSKTFNYAGHLNRHMRSHVKSYVCDRCSKKFKLKSAFEAHMRTHTGEKPFTCEVCGKTFNQKSHLKTHTLTHTGLKPFSCDLCEKSFRQRAQLISHLRTHTGERPFACNRCDMSFGHLTTLRKHKRLHSEVKTFACNICPMSFEQECSLTGHMRVHTACRPHACQKCDKLFLEARHLKEHMFSHSTERPYACERCGKTYKRAEHLKHHARLAKCIHVQPT